MPVLVLFTQSQGGSDNRGSCQSERVYQGWSGDRAEVRGLLCAVFLY